MSGDEIFWTASIDELSRGYIYDNDNDKFICLICYKDYENGVIFKRGEELLEAKKAIVHHITDMHGSMFNYLLNMGKKHTGLSDHQRELMSLFEKSLSDKEIEKKLDISPSTIRNHRFKLREKEKQAKIFLTIMSLLNEDKGKSNEKELIHIHKEATMVDERYAITKEEKEKVLATYFKHGLDGPITSFPSKEKRKIIILQEIVKRFDKNRGYSEKEVNEILKSIYSDFVTIRRYMIEYGFMDRNKDGSEYWIK
ncbi:MULTISPECIES: DUF2087 domain-containing protein [Bacillaceae]|uniref:DUF2087 domain-containing protein n=1 Tax=Evansella alkalicola TaxID=745819 RepID=A0ABS6JP84_9BACI|nr:DUF2087 domain-containing protein [Litchfieldia alkalitelluris]MBU9720373.1 DUF2087 domain-containing protein [Bacillus alkalicola]